MIKVSEMYKLAEFACGTFSTNILGTLSHRFTFISVVPYGLLNMDKECGNTKYCRQVASLFNKYLS